MKERKKPEPYGKSSQQSVLHYLHVPTSPALSILHVSRHISFIDIKERRTTHPTQETNPPLCLLSVDFCFLFLFCLQTPEDIYKSHLAESGGVSRRRDGGVQQVDSARANLASTFVNAFVNAGYGQDQVGCGTPSAVSGFLALFILLFFNFLLAFRLSTRRSCPSFSRPVLSFQQLLAMSTVSTRPGYRIVFRIIPHIFFFCESFSYHYSMIQGRSWSVSVSSRLLVLMATVRSTPSTRTLRDRPLLSS